MKRLIFETISINDFENSIQSSTLVLKKIAYIDLIQILYLINTQITNFKLYEWCGFTFYGRTIIKLVYEILRIASLLSTTAYCTLFGFTSISC